MSKAHRRKHAPRRLPSVIACYVERTIADNTRRGYESDVSHFLRHGGRLPATERMVALYLAKQADTLRVATLQRRLASIAWAHRQRRLRSPIGAPLVRDTMKGIRRAKGVMQRQVHAIDKPLLGRMLTVATNRTRLVALRDRALLLIGFGGALRRAELVSLDREDIRFTTSGIEVTIRRSKTDQVGASRTIFIPKAHGKFCAVGSLHRWLKAAGLIAGALFRAVTATGSVRAERLRGQSVALIVKRLVHATGANADLYSGHSLRAGYITLATQRGLSTTTIRMQTGHRSDAMLGRYVRGAFAKPPALR